MTEFDIMHENGNFWVCRDKNAYTVCENSLSGTHSVSVQSFAKDDLGLSLAIAYCDYKAKRREVLSVWDSQNLGVRS